MAAYPSAADYADTYDEPGPTRRRKRAVAPSVPQPATPNLDVPGPPAPGGTTLSTSAGMGALPVPAPMHSDVVGPPTPALPPGPEVDPKVGIPTEGLNKTGKRLAEIEAMRKADPTSKLHTTDWGYEYDPPERHPSRFRQALMGALQGALAGASQTGSLAGALGGAATGTAAGAINPRLMMALKRDQDIRRAQGQLSDDLGLQQKVAQIGSISAQTEENLAQAQEARAKANMSYAGEYTDPDTGEVIRMTPEQAAALRQRDRAETGRANRGGRGGPHYFERDEGVYTVGPNGQGVQVPGIPGKPRTDAQAGMAAEGAEASAQAGRAREDIQKEIDSLKGDALEGRRSITQKEALWKTEAAKRLKAALSNYVQGVDAKPTMQEMLDEVKAEDNDFTAGTYDDTVRNTEAKEKRLQELTGELTKVGAEQRKGTAQSKRSSAASAQGKQKGSDGKWHYTLSEIKQAAGDRYDDVLKQLQQRSDVVIDQ